MERDLPVKNYSGKGVSRREFLKFCSMVAATLALPSSMVPRIAEALEKRGKPVLVWLEFQDCAGDTESTLRATKPTLAQLVLDVFSLEYHETLMSAAGDQSEKCLADVVRNQKGKYITVVEGAIPLKDGGIYCSVGGRAAGISAHLVGREIREGATRKRPSDDKEVTGEEKIKRI